MKKLLLLQFLFRMSAQEKPIVGVIMGSKSDLEHLQPTLDLLTGFQSRIQPRLAEWSDEDLQDDLKLLQRFIDVLKGGKI